MSSSKKRKFYISIIILILVIIGIGIYDIYYTSIFPSDQNGGPDNISGNDFHHIQKTEFLMDTVISIDIFSRDKEEAEQALQEALILMEDWSDKVDRYQEDSLIYKINMAQEPVNVPEGIITMLEESRIYYEKSDGRFDPTVGPLLDLWGFGSEEMKIPSEEEIETVQEKIGFDRLEIDYEARQIYVPEGMSLDLGAVAKGYIVDRAVELLEEKGIDSALINAGGNIGVLGEKPDRPWNLGIKNPRDDAAEQIFPEYIMSLSEGGLATSGDYERYFMEDGVRYSHLINPHTGYQVREMRSSTIYAPTALKADILSTAVFIMGWEEGQKLINELDRIEGLLVRDDEVWSSDGFSDLLRD